MLKGRNFFLNRYEEYSLKKLQKDILAGIVVGVIAIPLGMAFAIASGVKPEYGIYTTIIAGILISISGGSKYQIGGPTGAFIPILFGIVITYGFENLLIAGFLAGILLLLMGVFKLGSLIKFIPKPVTIGFTSGIAIIIFTGQISNFLGLTEVENHEKFLDNIQEIIAHIHSLNSYSVIVAVICLVTLLLTPRFLPKIPGPLLGLSVSTVLATFFFQDQVATIGSTFGEIPNSVPQFKMLDITFTRIIELMRPAFVIAILGAIESLLSAVVADGMTNSKHSSNRELIGQGLANIITPFFSGIPATGAIARTATNIKNGAISPVSGIVHGFVVLIVLILFAPYASKIPLASMAPVLMVVAWNMSERKEFFHILKIKTSDSLVLVVTFVLTVFANLVIAVEVGLILAVVLFTKRMSEILVTAKALPNLNSKSEKIETKVVTDTHDCPQISIYNVEGPLFFGAAQTFEQKIMKAINLKPKVLLLRMGSVPFMDTTGESYLASIVNNFSKHGFILISEIKPQPQNVLMKTQLYDIIGAEHFFDHTGKALDFALSKVDNNKCIGCKHFAFRECIALSEQAQHGVEEDKRKKVSVSH